MYIGLLTARFGNEKSFEEIIRWAAGAGYRGLELSTQHLDLDAVAAEGGKAVKALVAETGVRIASLAYYSVVSDRLPAEDYQAGMRKTIAAASALGVDTVCTLSGFPIGGRSKTATIREVLPGIFAPLAEEAAAKGIRIAFENWFATNLQGLEHFAALVEALPQENIGFNFDPSHLYWQQLDYLAAVAEFKSRIFHIHAKDVAIRRDLLARTGILGSGWWRYVIPGYGEIPWGRFICALREIGYDGIISVEHEDGTFSAEEGFTRAIGELGRYV